MVHMLLLTNMAATRDFSGRREVSCSDSVLTGHISVGDDVTFPLEPPESSDGDC